MQYRLFLLFLLFRILSDNYEALEFHVKKIRAEMSRVNRLEAKHHLHSFVCVCVFEET